MDPTQSNKGEPARELPRQFTALLHAGRTWQAECRHNLIYPKMPGTFADGTSNTLLYATKYQNCGKIGGSMWADTNAANSPTAATFGVSMALWQKAPGQAACDPTAGTAVSFTAQTIQVAMCDASVRSVAASLRRGHMASRPNARRRRCSGSRLEQLTMTRIHLGWLLVLCLVLSVGFLAPAVFSSAEDGVALVQAKPAGIDNGGSQLPAGVIRSLAVPVFRHKGPVTELAIVNGGKQFISGSAGMKGRSSGTSPRASG